MFIGLACITAAVALDAAQHVELQVVRLEQVRARQRRHFLGVHRVHQLGCHQDQQLCLVPRHGLLGEENADERQIADT